MGDGFLNFLAALKRLSSRRAQLLAFVALGMWALTLDANPYAVLALVVAAYSLEPAISGIREAVRNRNQSKALKLELASFKRQLGEDQKLLTHQSGPPDDYVPNLSPASDDKLPAPVPAAPPRRGRARSGR